MGGAGGGFLAWGSCHPSFLLLSLRAYVFNSVGGCAGLWQEAVGLASLSVYGVEVVIFYCHLDSELMYH